MRTHGHREGSTKHWGLLGEMGRTSGRGRWGGIAWGETQNVGEGEEGSKSHCHVCTYATILHVLHMYPKTKNAIKNKNKTIMGKNTKHSLPQKLFYISYHLKKLNRITQRQSNVFIIEELRNSYEEGYYAIFYIFIYV